MSKQIWHRKLATIRFYIVTFRRLSLFLVVSIVLNLGLGGVVYYLYFHQGERSYYATNGIVSPIKLSVRDKPNFSSQAILSTPEVVEQEDKPIPE